MKKLILAIFLLLFGCSLFAQSLTQIYSKTFKWSLQPDGNVTFVFITEDNREFVNGWDGGTFSAIGSFSNGDTIWKKTDTLSSSLSDLQFCVHNTRIFYPSSSASNGRYLIIRNKISGEMIGAKQIEGDAGFTNYGDSIIGVVGINPAKIIILSEGGNIGRQFSLGYSLTNGYITVKYLNGYVWIFGLYYSSGYNSFAEKRNVLTGQLVWRKQFSKAFKCRGDIDTNGNAYIGILIDSTARNPFGMAKIDPSGNIVWERYWYPNKTDAANKENYLNGIAVSKKNIVVFAGECERDSISNTSYQASYFMGRDAETGDSLFANKTVNAANTTVDHNNAVAFDTSGYAFVVIGKFRVNGINTCFLKKYRYDTMTGIRGNNEDVKSFTLSQNYPNPFNPVTRIRFSIPKKGHITIKVCDILGKEITTLVNEVKTVGNYSVDFNGSNLPSGTYFYRIETDGFSETKKMVLVK